jgi:signal transduction histidine kinase
VCDAGPGIPAADALRIFERFYRGESLREFMGSGLGLTIAEHAARRASGTPILESSVPGNTAFSLRLPLV